MDDLPANTISYIDFEGEVNHILHSSLLDQESHTFAFLDFNLFNLIDNVSVYTEHSQLILQIKTLLKKTLIDQDCLTHLVADKFMIIFKDCDIDAAKAKGKSLLEDINSHPFSCKTHCFNIQASIGLVPITHKTKDFAELLTHASFACSIAKEDEETPFRIYQETDFKIAQKHQDILWAARLKDSLKSDNFCLYAQPISSLAHPDKKYFEILLRMKDSAGKHVLPANFLPVAERCHLMPQVDRWVITKTINVLKANPKFLNSIEFCSINLSGQSLEEEKMQQFVIDKLGPVDICPHRRRAAA